MFRSRLISVLCWALLCWSVLSQAPTAVAQTSSSPRVVTIGSVVDGPWERNGELRQLFQNEIIELTRGEFEVRFPDDKFLVGDWTRASISAAADRLLEDPRVDLVLGLGLIATAELGSRGPLPKPVVAPIGVNIEIQQLPFENGTSGTKNLSYLLLPRTLMRDLETFHDIYPFEKIAVLVNAYLMDGLPGFDETYFEGIRDLGADYQVIRIRDSVDEGLAEIGEDFDAAYLLPLKHLNNADFRRLLDGLEEKKLPSFSYFGEEEVVLGVMASLNPDIFPRLARRIAINVQRILLGEEPGSIPVAYAPGERLTINMGTARAIGFSPSWAVMTEARLINERAEDHGRTLRLHEVVDEARKQNLALASARRNVAAGEKAVDQARSPILPQIDLSALGRSIDDDRAAAALGGNPEHRLTGTAALRQAVLAEDVWANYSVSNRDQEVRIYGLETAGLDITQGAAQAYLEVLAQKTAEKIQKENLELTRANLEMAEVRVLVGYAGPEEVYRWTNELASNRIDLIEVNALRNVSEIALNRILNRPLEEPFRTVEMDLNDASLMTSDGRFDALVGDKRSFHHFRDFMVAEGFANSPEIHALDSRIAAQRRLLQNASRSFWLPDLFLIGDVTYEFGRSGAGSDFGIPGVSPQENLFQQDDVYWNIGLQASYPLFTGLDRSANKGRISYELEALELDRRDLANAIEQRIRNSLHLAGSSYAAIEQSRLGAEAARNNLELVTDKYSRGAVTIIELIDAQNQALVADQAAANSIYAFLIDYVEVERSIGKFYSFDFRDEWDDFFGRARTFVGSQ